MNLYRQLIFPKRANYVVYWLVVGTLFFLLGEMLMRAIDEPIYFRTRLSVTYVGFCAFIIAAIYSGDSFAATLMKLETVIEAPMDDYGDWVKAKTTEFFTLSTKTSRIVVLSIGLAATVTASWLTEPTSPPILNVIFIASMVPFYFVGALSVYSLAALLRFVAQVVRYPVKVPFFAMNQSGIRDLSGFYMRTALIVLLAYIWLVATVWLSPYDFTVPVLVWLTLIGFFPLAMFLWSFYQIHILMHRTKAKDTSLISKHVQDALFELQASPSKDAAEKLSELMTIHRKVEDLRDWPVSAGGILTVGVTALVPAINIALRLGGF